MRPKSMILLVLALGCGLVASIGISQVMDRKAPEGPRGPETEAIYVALSDINLGDTITAEMVELQEWPKDKIQPGAARELGEVLDRRPRTKIYQGDPILDAKLVSSDSLDMASEQIPNGYRAFPVRVTEDTGTAGLARAGDRVDIQLYVTKDIRKGIDETKVHTILENVRVFAVDQSFRRDTEYEDAAPIARTITLIVTSREASILNLATETGRIRLILRHPDDVAESDGDRVTLDMLLTAKSEADPEKERGEEGGPDSGLSSFLDGINNGSEESDPVYAPFVMAILEGDSVRQVEFPQDGSIPQNENPPSENAGDAGPQLTPSSDNSEPAAGADVEKMNELKKELGFLND